MTSTEQIWSQTIDIWSNRASKRWRQEKNSVVVRASKRRRYELNSDEKRASKSQSLAREFRSRTAANVT